MEKKDKGEEDKVNKEPEILSNDGPDKKIDELNDYYISETFSKIENVIDKDIVIQSGGLKPKEAFDQIASERKQQQAKYLGDARLKSGKEGTICQRISRINKEIDEITKELKVIEEEKTKKGMSEIQYPGEAFEELEEVKKKLGEVMKSKGYQDLIQWNSPVDSSKIIPSELNEKLTTRLVQSIASITDPIKKEEGKSDLDVVYELYFNKQVSDLQDANRYMELEKKIVSLEKIIGNWKESPEFATISTTIDYLSQMILHLNPALTAEKISSLQETIAEIKKYLFEKGESKKDFDKGDIEELYELSKSALEYYKVLPHIVDKLSALKYLHEQSASLMNRIIAIEQAQATITTTLKDANEMLEGVKTGLNANMKTIEGNLKSLDARLSMLKPK